MQKSKFSEFFAQQSLKSLEKQGLFGAKTSPDFRRSGTLVTGILVTGNLVIGIWSLVISHTLPSFTLHSQFTLPQFPCSLLRRFAEVPPVPICRGFIGAQFSYLTDKFCFKNPRRPFSQCNSAHVHFTRKSSNRSAIRPPRVTSSMFRTLRFFVILKTRPEHANRKDSPRKTATKKVFHKIDRPTRDGCKNESRRRSCNSDVTAFSHVERKKL